MEVNVKVLYEDKCLIVFDKPSGLLVIPAVGRSPITLTYLVNQRYASMGGERLHPCHRLDEQTSGVIIYAKGKRNQKTMMDVFHHRAVKKKYIAFVKGRMKRKSGCIKGFIIDQHKKRFLKDGAGRPMSHRGKMAQTLYQVKEIRGSFSIVEVYPQTGRTHQIRIHFKQIGHPLLGERLYAFRKDFDINFRRLALHAQEVSFRHPVTKKDVVVRSELPQDMKDFLKKFH